MDYSKYLKNNDTIDKRIKYFRNLITRVLISIILILICVITIKVNSTYKDIIEKHLFTDNLSFNKVNKYLSNNLGTIIPEVSTHDELVFSSRELKTKEYELLSDHARIKLNNNSPISTLCGGIVVFIGEKDNLGNTIIIQGNDGYDIWYSNIVNTSVNLYDYIETDTLIGESNGEYINIKVLKDGNIVSYEEYIK